MKLKKVKTAKHGTLYFDNSSVFVDAAKGVVFITTPKTAEDLEYVFDEEIDVPNDKETEKSGSGSYAVYTIIDTILIKDFLKLAEEISKLK